MHGGFIESNNNGYQNWPNYRYNSSWNWNHGRPLILSVMWFSRLRKKFKVVCNVYTISRFDNEIFDKCSVVRRFTSNVEVMMSNYTYDLHSFINRLVIRCWLTIDELKKFCWSNSIFPYASWHARFSTPFNPSPSNYSPQKVGLELKLTFASGTCEYCYKPSFFFFCLKLTPYNQILLATSIICVRK